MSAGHQTVHVRVNDAATGQPTPVRIRFTGPDGTYYAPFGRLTKFAVGRNADVGGNLLYGTQEFAYIDGTCEIRLPTGPITVEVSKGPEYTPLCYETELSSGKLALRLEVQRCTNLRQERWYSGDTRAHFLTPHAALLEGAAEDLAVINLLASVTQIAEVEDPFGLAISDPHPTPTYPAIPNILAFSGQRPALEVPGHLVVVNTHNCHPRLGSLGLLNCHRVVYPMTFGYQWLNEIDDWTLADWCDQCHRKNGLVVWTETDLSIVGRNYGEALADFILGKVDAIEVSRFPWQDDLSARPFNWYGLLSSGFRAPLVGSSEKLSNHVPLGAVRTYARLEPDQEWNYRNWIDAIRAGRTFVTNGPTLLFSANGLDPGSLVTLPSPTRTVQIHTEGRSILPFERLEVVANGTIVASAEVTEGSASTSIDAEILLPVGGWLAARCWGSRRLPGYFSGQCVYAHTSPIYVRVEGHPPPVDNAAVAFFRGELDKSLQWVEQEGRVENDRQRERLADIFREASQELLRRQNS